MNEPLKVILFNTWMPVAYLCCIGAFWEPALLSLPIYHWLALVRIEKQEGA